MSADRYGQAGYRIAVLIRDHGGVLPRDPRVLPLEILPHFRSNGEAARNGKIVAGRMVILAADDLPRVCPGAVFKGNRAIKLPGNKLDYMGIDQRQIRRSAGLQEEIVGIPDRNIGIIDRNRPLPGYGHVVQCDVLIRQAGGFVDSQIVELHRFVAHIEKHLPHFRVGELNL